MTKKNMMEFNKPDPLAAKIIDEIQKEQNKILSKLPPDIQKEFHKMEIRR